MLLIELPEVGRSLFLTCEELRLFWSGLANGAPPERYNGFAEERQPQMLSLSKDAARGVTENSDHLRDASRQSGKGNLQLDRERGGFRHGGCAGIGNRHTASVRLRNAGNGKGCRDLGAGSLRDGNGDAAAIDGQNGI